MPASGCQGTWFHQQSGPPSIASRLLVKPDGIKGLPEAEAEYILHYTYCKNE